MFSVGQLTFWQITSFDVIDTAIKVYKRRGDACVGVYLLQYNGDGSFASPCYVEYTS